MRTRQLVWEDVNCGVSMQYDGLGKPQKIWRDSGGRTRVFASLNLLSPVNITMWVQDYTEITPALQGLILLQLHRKLRKLVHSIKAYENYTDVV